MFNWVLNMSPTPFFGNLIKSPNLTWRDSRRTYLASKNSGQREFVSM